MDDENKIKENKTKENKIEEKLEKRKIELSVFLFILLILGYVTIYLIIFDLMNFILPAVFILPTVYFLLIFLILIILLFIKLARELKKQQRD